MSLADTVARVRSGMIQIAFGNADDVKIGGGSGFLCNGHLVTNHHIFLGHLSAAFVVLRHADAPAGAYWHRSAKEFGARLITGSEEHSYDYAVMRVPELKRTNEYQFSLGSPSGYRVGDEIALLGFPLEHDNLTCHRGIISSFYTSGVANVVQLDASVNAGNSGGPLIDPESGTVLGLVTRKATGLSALFSQLRATLDANIDFVETATAGAGISIGGFGPIEATIASQKQIKVILDEIERQANVGIGYAISAEHLLAEACMQ